MKDYAAALMVAVLAFALGLLVSNATSNTPEYKSLAERAVTAGEFFKAEYEKCRSGT